MNKIMIFRLNSMIIFFGNIAVCLFDEQNHSLNVPDQAVHVILPVAPAGGTGLASGSCQMFGGILPLASRILFVFMPLV